MRWILSNTFSWQVSKFCKSNYIMVLTTRWGWLLLDIGLFVLFLHILQKYCKTAYSRNRINQMSILCTEFNGEHLLSLTFNHVTSIKSFDFCTLYTTIPHHILKNRLTSIIRNAFIFKNRRYKYLVFRHKETYFVNEHSSSKIKYSEDDIIKMLEFLVDIFFVIFAGKVFQQSVSNRMVTNCVPLLASSLFVFIRSGIHIACALNEKVTTSPISVHCRIEVPRDVWNSKGP